MRKHLAIELLENAELKNWPGLSFVFPPFRM